MKKFTIGQRIVFGFGTITAIVAALGIFAFVQMIQIRSLSTRVGTESLPGMYAGGQLAEKVQVFCNQNGILLLRLCLLQDDDMKKDCQQQILDAVADIEKQIDSQHRIPNDPSQGKLLDAIKTAEGSYKDTLTKILAQITAGNPQDAMESKQSDLDPAAAALIAAVDASVDYNKNQATNVGAQIQGAVNHANSALVVGMAFVLGGALGISTLIVLSTTRRLGTISRSLEDASAQVASAGQQVAGSSQAVAEGAEGQATSLRQTGQSLAEMRRMIEQSVSTAESAKSIADEARAAAEAGVADVQTMAEAMSAIQAANDNISGIIKVINEIALQTNLLALNAAVEAARAGETGRGFAVVANEVHTLAARAKEASGQISTKIEDSLAKGRYGAQVSEKVAAGLGQIAQKAQKVNALIAEMAQASHEQARGIRELDSTMAALDQVTQSNATSAVQSATASRALTEQAGALGGAVHDLLDFAGARTGHGDLAINMEPQATEQRSAGQPCAEPSSTEEPVSLAA
jgi:methyl-accepting chemotaxis protein